MDLYKFVVVDDYFGFTWTLFLAHKGKTFETFVNFAKIVQNVFILKIITLQSDHEDDFIKHQFQNICTKNGAYNFSFLRTP